MSAVYQSFTQASLKGKKVLLRAGFDVPIENGVVTDQSRIEATVPTIQKLLAAGAAVIIIAHQDRPKGKIVPEYSQRPIVPILERLLGAEVGFAPSCTGSETKAMVDNIAPGQVLLLENLRFDAREEQNDESFAQELASYADVYVDDAFTNAHRKHASMVAVAKLLPAYMGLQLAEEVEHLSRIVDHPKSPVTLIICGAKIETKLPVIEYFLDKGDHILLGGAIANTFLAAQGFSIGTSLYEESFVSTARDLLSQKKRAVIHVPTDVIVAAHPDQQVGTNVAVDSIPSDQAIFDVGTETQDSYCACIEKSHTVVWNGPLGMYEKSPFSAASLRIATSMQSATKKGATTIIGGGDTVDFHHRYNLPLASYTFVSMGGGAMLDFVSGKELPAIAALRHS